MKLFTATLAAVATLSCAPDYAPQKQALVNLFDHNRDGCVVEVDDLMARDAVVAARGASGFNAWRAALGLCL
jgi:hypothetical protein